MKKKYFSKLLLSFISVFGIVTSTSMYIASTNSTNSKFPSAQNVLTTSGTNTHADDTTNEVKPLIPAQANGQNSFLSTPQGPLVYWNNKITSLDWFGAQRWSIDFSSDEYVPMPSGGYQGSWLRSWFNWDYDRSRDILWVLSYGDSKNPQKLYSINATTGEVTKTITVTGSNGSLKFVSALSSGNVMMWDGASSSYAAQATLYNASTGAITQISGNSSSIMSSVNGNGTGNNGHYRWYFTNVIPIKSGENLVELESFSTVSTTGDDGAVNASYDVYFVLTDDNLNMIATSGTWASAQLAVHGLQGYRNTSITAQRDYYQLLDGRVATVIYNSIVIINPNDSSAPNNLSFNVFTPSQNWILSWSFDTNENLFYKYKDDSKIYKIGAATLSGSSSSVTPYTYYDLSSASNNSIKEYANNFVLYNVYGYQGQIMLINASYNDYIDVTKNPDITSDNNPDQYGLAVAITQNPNNENAGDSKGLLNTADAFQFSADFSIAQSTLNSKLPSEIVSGDLVITNDGFLTNNTNYTAFSKVMDDASGTLTVTAYIDQIPWFVSNGVMPSNISPTKITKTYTGLNQVADRISWKDTSADYDFANTLPSKVDQTDLTRFDPATFNINSQTVVDTSGNILYPKKTYTISNTDDDTGQITITATYQYMPLGMPATTNNVLTATSSHTYTIFKNSDAKQFVFTGQTTTGTGSPIDVSTIPQLAALLESDVLPSSFVSTASADPSTYLQFVNTDLSSGYPTSKMQFSFIPNDTNGTLTVNAQLPSGYYPNSSSNSFSQTYIGLNKSSNYLFSWKTTPTIQNQSTTLPSQITESQIFSDFITYRGFNPLDMNITLLPDDDSGTLTVQVTLSGNYPTNIKTANNFSQVGNLYIATKIYSGFLTKTQQNNQYKLVFKNDTDQSLNDLKKLTTQQIYTAFNPTDGSTPTGLTIDDKKYSTLKDLVSELLVSSSGVSLPSIESDDVTVTMYYNNGNGTADFVVQYPESVNSLIFVGSFTGFVLGNDIVTDDVLSFKTQSALEAEVAAASSSSPLYNLFSKNVYDAKTWIENNLSQLVQYESGQYQSLIASKSYTITIATNEIYGTVSAIVQFKGLTNSQSVSLFAFDYSGFKKGN